MRYRTLTAVVVSTVIAAMAACSGGPSAGIDRLGVTSGTITGFASVFVNGVEFGTSGAAISIDGQSGGTESQLHVGHVVRVTGTISADGKTGTADKIEFDYTLKGPVSSITPAANTFVVLGQTVLVDSDTSFDPAIVPGSLAGLSVLEFVKISGFIDANGKVRATRIEPGSGELEVRGTVSGLTATTFMINALTVDYSGVVPGGFGGGALSDGDLVEAKGNALNGSGQLVATEVQFEGDQLAGGEDGGRSEVEGFITRVGTADFDVAGVTVITDAQTAASLIVNEKVEVEGTLNASGALVADKIVVKSATGEDEADIEIAAVVDVVDAMAGNLSLLGITVTVDAQTRLEDKKDNPVRAFSLANIVAGDRVDIRGVATGTTTVLATRLERTNPDVETDLRGPVSALTDPTFTILGVTITTDLGTQFFQSEGGPPADAATFFATVNTGTVVKVTGTEPGVNGILADKIELHVED